MKTRITSIVCTVVLAASALWAFQDMPKPAGPAKEHAFLKQFVGEWTSEWEMMAGPDQPPMKAKGSASGRMIGDFWSVTDVKADWTMGPMSAVLTIGYNPEKKKYVGTWVDSMMNHMWVYEGEVDAAGKVLALNADGPDMTNPSKTAKFRDSFEFKDADNFVLTSEAQDKDGKWMKIGAAKYVRKK
ncbi:MAG: DUF1579 domain-containing protein [Phycisphaerae bacterium]